MEVFEFLSIVLDFLCFLAPILIWISVGKFIKEQERHNSAVEMRLDVLVREIKKLMTAE